MIPEVSDTKDHILLANVDITHGATATANFDTRGGSYATIRILLGSEADAGATNPTISILESDDTVVTNFATITADEQPANTNEFLKSYKIDLRGRKRYLRVSVTAASGSTNNNLTIAGAVGTLTRLSNGPKDTTESVVDTTDYSVTVV